MTVDALHRGNDIAKELKELYEIRNSLKGMLDSGGESIDFSFLVAARKDLPDIFFNKKNFKLRSGNFKFPDLAEAWNKELMRAIFFMHSEVEAKIKSLEEEFSKL